MISAEKVLPCPSSAFLKCTCYAPTSTIKRGARVAKRTFVPMSLVTATWLPGEERSCSKYL